MKLKTIAAVTMTVALTGTGAIAISQLATSSPVEAGERGDVKRASYHKRSERLREHGGLGGRDVMRAVAREADTNNDRALTQDEINVFIETKVDGADADGDGQLVIEEFDVIFRELTRNRMVDAFQRLDENGDGVISQEEIDAHFGDVVARMDRNDDGKLNRADRGHRSRHDGAGRRHGPRSE